MFDRLAPQASEHAPRSVVVVLACVLGLSSATVGAVATMTATTVAMMPELNSMAL